MIEETVRREVGALCREVGALRTELNARIEAIDFKFKAICRVLGLIAMMQLAIFAALIRLLLSEDRTPPPPPPSPTLQAPVETEAAPLTEAVPGSEVPAPAEPDGASVAADPRLPDRDSAADDDRPVGFLE